MNQTITELILTTTVVLPYSGLCELFAYTTEGAGYFELFYDDEWIAYFRVGQDGRLETLADEQEGKQHVTYPSLPPTARLPVAPAFPLAHFRLCLRRGNRLDERVDEASLPLSMPQKHWLAQRLPRVGSPWGIIGLTENSILSACEFGGVAWGVRRLSVAYADPQQASLYQTVQLHTFERLQPSEAWDRSMLPHDEDWVGVVHQPRACYSTPQGVIVVDHVPDGSGRVRLLYGRLDTPS